MTTTKRIPEIGPDGILFPMVRSAAEFRAEELAFWRSLGLDMLFAGGDWTYLYTQAQAALELLK